MPTRHGVVLGGACSIEDAARTGLPNTVVIAGATPANGRSAGEMRVARWLRANARRIPRIVSICTGAFVLGEAGLLDRRSATTHWVYRDELRNRFSRACVESDSLFLRDGRIWTSAGITAGLDLMLAIIEEDHGHRAALTVAKSLVLYLRRSDRQAMFFDESIVPEQELDSSVNILTALIQGHLAKPLPIARLAKLAGEDHPESNTPVVTCAGVGRGRVVIRAGSLERCHGVGRCCDQAPDAPAGGASARPPPSALYSAIALPN